MAKEVFGEGICSLQNGNFVRLTWTDDIVDLLDSNLNVVETMPMFPGVKEGWGITRSGTTLYISNGSDQINKINAVTFEHEGIIKVTQGEQPLRNLNELEYVDGKIWANIFMTDDII